MVDVGDDVDHVPLVHRSRQTSEAKPQPTIVLILVPWGLKAHDHLLLKGELTLPIALELCKGFALLRDKKHLSWINISRLIADHSKALAIIHL
ncbi:hypothetical protein Ancab_004585 [Ancistrocladus abbreviatus]